MWGGGEPSLGSKRRDERAIVGSRLGCRLNPNEENVFSRCARRGRKVKLSISCFSFLFVSPLIGLDIAGTLYGQADLFGCNIHANIDNGGVYVAQLGMFQCYLCILLIFS